MRAPLSFFSTPFAPQLLPRFNALLHPRVEGRDD
jgi:hypothetical protein